MTAKWFEVAGSKLGGVCAVQSLMAKAARAKLRRLECMLKATRTIRTEDEREEEMECCLLDEL